MTQFDETVQSEALALARLVEFAAWNQKYGSFSARNPTLGRMVFCPFCGQRRRQSEICCNPKYLPGTENDKIHFKGRKNPRLTRNRPPLFSVHDILVCLERQKDFKEYEGLAGVVEARVKRKKETKAKKIRKQQQKSRKANRRK